ncbi:MAG: hypothetical protein EP334_10050 [Gammaproteobacteria bacterium]|nr:MAG: hypothetical protein EP334_10050 [Gammaproteobacteria bacterium]
MTTPIGALRKSEVTGMEELQKKISSIIYATDKKIVAQAVRAALKPMLNAARANAPTGKDAHRTRKGRLVSPGHLKRNIVLRKLKTAHSSIIAYGIWAHGEAYYGQIIEQGWVPGKRTKAQRNYRDWLKRGSTLRRKRRKQLSDPGSGKKIPGKPWLGPAYRAHKDQVASNFEKAMVNKINAAMKRIKKVHL